MVGSKLDICYRLLPLITEMRTVITYALLGTLLRVINLK